MDEIFTYSRFRDASQIVCTQQQIGLGTCQPYSIVELKSGAKVETISRVYPKLFSTISELGGFGDLIFISVSFIYMFYNSFYYGRWMKREIISKSEEKSYKKISRKFKLDGEEFKKLKENYLNEKLSGVDVLKNNDMIETFSNTVMSEEYSKVLAVLPILKLMKEKQEEHFGTEKKKKCYYRRSD